MEEMGFTTPPSLISWLAVAKFLLDSGHYTWPLGKRRRQAVSGHD